MDYVEIIVHIKSLSWTRSIQTIECWLGLLYYNTHWFQRLWLSLTLMIDIFPTKLSDKMHYL